MDDRYAAPLVRVLIMPKWYPWPDDPVFGVFCREHAKASAVHHDVVVLAFRPEPMAGARLYRLWEDADEPLRTVRLVYRRPRLRPAAMATQLVGMVAALRHLRRAGWSPDVIHAHVFSAAFPAVLLGHALRRPVVVSEHFTAFQRGLVRGYDRLVARAAFRGAALVCPVSDDLRRQLEQVEPAAGFEVVPNVVDSERFHPPPDARPRPAREPARLLNVGWLHEKKAQADLVEAVALLRDRGRPVELDIVGEGDERAALEQRVRGRGLGGAVRLLGSRSPDEIAALMREADLFVLPSRFENLPVVLLEAMASGLPVVATTVGGVPEIVDPSFGELVAPGDTDRLATAIAGMLERRASFDPATLADRARREYGMRAIADRWDAVYRTVAGKARPARVGGTAAIYAGDAREP